MTEQRPPTKRQLQAAETRERMLIAAGKVFAEHGYKATTVGAITDAAGTAHGTFYLYFKNKDDALTQVLQAVIETIQRRPEIAEGASRAERTEVMVRSYIGVLGANPGLYRALLEGMLQSATIEQVWLDMRETFVQRIAAGLQRVEARGEMRPLTDDQQAARALVSMCEWHAFVALGLGHGRPGQEDVEGAIATVTELWNRATWGVYAP
jgi:AcrR family transcriptional regulator